VATTSSMAEIHRRSWGNPGKTEASSANTGRQTGISGAQNLWVCRSSGWLCNARILACQGTGDATPRCSRCLL